LPSLKGSNNPNWKGGKVDNGSGYLMIKRLGYQSAKKDGYVYEHRLVMEEHLGRKLESYEIVHHKNGNKKDNRIENLEVITQSEHVGIHLTKDKSNRICYQCGSNNTGVDKNGWHKWYKHFIWENEWVCNKCYMKNRRSMRLPATAY
jgi:hypothetical protein